MRGGAIRKDKKFFGEMLEAEALKAHATLKRFSPKSESKALEIIRPYLKTKFIPQISKEMVHPKGPKLSLGKTGAGQIVADNVEKRAELQEEMEKVRKEREVLAQKYNEELFAEFAEKRNKLIKQIRLHRSGRWIVRTVIVGGAIAATVLTLGPGASVFALEPVYEKVIRRQRRNEQKAKTNLEAEFKKRSQGANQLKSVDADWLWDSNVKNLHDLDDGAYSMRSNSTEDLILATAKKGEKVGMVVEEAEEAEEVDSVGEEAIASTDSDPFSDDEDDFSG